MKNYATLRFPVQPGSALRCCSGASWCAAELWLVNRSAHRRHLSAIRFQVALLSISRVNFAICSHWAACFRNSSGGSIGMSFLHKCSSLGTALLRKSRRELCEKCNLRDFVPAAVPNRYRKTADRLSNAMRNMAAGPRLLGQGAAASGSWSAEILPPGRNKTAAPLSFGWSVGAGPSGFYAAEALLRCGLPVRVDMIERFPPKLMRRC
jgi:hypothetical protein